MRIKLNFKKGFSYKKTVVFLVSCVLLLTTVKTSAFYDITAALDYADAHFDDSEGLCAEFASDCLRAGGVNICEKTAEGLYKELSLSNPAYKLIVENDLRIKTENNKDMLSPGDAVIQYCVDCDDYFHAVICGGEYNGYMTYYAHNYAHGNTPSDIFYNVGNSSHREHNIEAYSVHIKDGVRNESAAEKFIDFCLYSVTASSGLNMRSDSDLKSEIVCTISFSELINVYPSLSEGDWLYCKYNGFKGFVNKNYVRQAGMEENPDLKIEISGKSTLLAPVIIENRAMLPVRGIFEALGGEISWNDTYKRASVHIDGHAVTLSCGSDVMYVNGKAKRLIIPSVIQDGKMYVGARGVAEGLGKNVNFENNVISIN